MKRLMPSGLISFLQTTAARNVLKADLFAITLPTGTTFYTTEGQFSITVPSGTPGWSGSTTTFHSMEYGRWNRGAITSEAGFDLKANTMELTCLPQPATVYPGLAIGILNGALNGLFDGATVSVFTAYMPIGSYGNVSNGIETKFTGTVTKISSINRTKVVFDCADPFYLLDMKVPTRLFQSTCPWGFADGNCAVSGGAAAFTTTFTAKTGSTQWVLTPVTAFSGAGAADHYFEQGVVKCLTGKNAGLALTVKLHAGGNLTTMNAWLLPIAAGDTFSVIAGCDKSMSTCSSKFNNLVHFGGHPFTPVPATAI